ncbi:hypothetical protein GCM10022261_05210 [Brevibacterium daeguense]|uniref:Pyridoxamine 5'-phosphate oxidase n=1 Tax=Brevibacterium daeguense TaxID=909936 RepID=A0ABP8EGJ5_9MICO|nr:hypothetical protein [Brevibacterium daeguense]
MNSTDAAVIAQIARQARSAVLEVGAAGCRSAERRLSLVEIDAAHHMWFFTWAPVRHLAEELSDREVTLTFGDEVRGASIEGRIWGHREVAAKLARWGMDPQAAEQRAELVPLVLEVVPLAFRCWGGRRNADSFADRRSRTAPEGHPADPFRDRVTNGFDEDSGPGRVR